MSDIIFKLNNPLTLEKGTGVSLAADGKGFDKKDFDGTDVGNINIAIGQEVNTDSSVTFSSVRLSPDTITIGTGSNQIVLSDKSISGSVSFVNSLVISEKLTPEAGLTFKGTLSAPSQSFAATQTTQSLNTGSRKFGTEVDNHSQHFTGSLETTGSLKLNGYLVNGISNDTTLSGSSTTKLVTENVAGTYLQTLKPDRNYLRKSFVHTGSFTNSSTSSFNAITASAPSNLTSTTENDFMFFINGMVIENDALEIVQKTSTNLELRLDTNSLGYSIEANDEIIGFGKFNS